MSDTKQIVSMLAAETKITLFTALGEVLELPEDGPHDTSKLAEHLTQHLTGGNVVEINLNDYLTIHRAIVPEGYENTGIVMTHIIDGVEVQGIFYPSSVAVAVQHEGEEVVIPKVEKLEKHANRANAEKSPAVRNFLRRIAPVVKDRLHSAEDLMDFIERSELPLTNDGMIIGYKKVNKTSDGYFVDVHSGKIKQRVGSRVWMDVDAVDPSRNQSCSHGLHVANLGYLSGFSGNHTLIVLVDPKDFIAVPHNETNKCRVCSYDIIGVMTARGHEMVSSGSFVKEDQTFKSVISDAVAGRSIKPFEAIKVGTKEILQVDELTENDISVHVALEPTVAETKESSGESLNSDKAPEKKAKKDIVKMARQATGNMPWDGAPSEVLNAFTALRTGSTKTDAAKAGNTSTRTLQRWMDKYDYDGWATASEGSMTRADRARMYFNNAAWETLLEFKRQAKKGWAALGFNKTEISQIEKAIA
ncbi:RIIB-like protein [Sulfitobacter phage vB_SupP_AX]|nr:RIIB-like protein [Sulfitobacter phage vB_SupP_AX]